MTTRWAAVAVLASAGVVGACAAERPVRMESAVAVSVAHQQVQLQAAAKNADRGQAARPLVAVSGRREGGMLLLADLSDRRLALIADEDAGAVRVLDARTHEPVSNFVLAGRPAQMALGSDGRLYVALRDHSQVQSLEIAQEPHGDSDAPTLVDAGRFSTATEPLALSTTPQGGELLVASGWGKQLQRISLRDGSTTTRLKLPREPRAIAVTDDGKHAFVAHAVGSAITRIALNEAIPTKTALWVGGTDNIFVRPIRKCGGCLINTFKGIGDEGGTPRHAVQGFALASFRGEVIAPMVLAHPGERPVGGYGTSGGFAAHQPVLAVASGDKEEVMVRAPNRMFAASLRRTNSAGDLGHTGCVLPRAIAVDPTREVALVSCLGVDRVDVLQLNHKSLVRSTLARWKVPAGPVGIAVDAKNGEALVWSQYASTLSSLTLPGMPDEQRAGTTFAQLPKPQPARRVTTLPPLDGHAGRTQLSTTAKRGRELFHAAGDLRLSGDSRACASCHPDGREDGISWPTPQGRSQTPILAGRLGAELAPTAGTASRTPWSSTSNTPSNASAAVD